MNTSFAEKDLVTLRYVCADAQYSKLKNEIKRRPKGGRLSWSMQGEIIPPRIVAAYIGNLAQDLTLFQIVVRLKTKQVRKTQCEEEIKGEMRRYPTHPTFPPERGIV